MLKKHKHFIQLCASVFFISFFFLIQQPEELMVRVEPSDKDVSAILWHFWEAATLQKHETCALWKNFPSSWKQRGAGEHCLEVMRLLSIVVRLSNISRGVGERLSSSGPRWIPFLPDNGRETGALIVDCNTLATQRGGISGGEKRPRALEILHLTYHLWIRQSLGSEKFAGPLTTGLSVLMGRRWKIGFYKMWRLPPCRALTTPVPRNKTYN